MGKNSGIAWTDHTFSPWHGCVKVSPACDHCYAAEWDARFINPEHKQENMREAHWGKDAPRRFFGDKHWNEPVKWNRDAAASGKRTLVFCASMADVFETGRSDLTEHRQRLWALIRTTPALTWLLLTKRPQNIKKLLPENLASAPNIWLGTTIESPDFLWRADALNENEKAHIRFVSMEPLIEQTSIIEKIGPRGVGTGIHWVITGCESGDNARHTPTDWYRQLRDECRETSAAFFLKQPPRGADGITIGEGSWLKLKDGIVEQPYLDGHMHVAWPG